MFHTYNKVYLQFSASPTLQHYFIFRYHTNVESVTRSQVWLQRCILKICLLALVAKVHPSHYILLEQIETQSRDREIENIMIAKMLSKAVLLYVWSDSNLLQIPVFNFTIISSSIPGCTRQLPFEDDGA